MVNLDLDAVDGDFPRLDQVTSSLSTVKIEQREPKMQMQVEVNGPSLVGEWFQIKVRLLNSENGDAKNVSIVATLEEADDLIIADTTRITLDYR